MLSGISLRAQKLSYGWPSRKVSFLLVLLLTLYRVLIVFSAGPVVTDNGNFVIDAPFTPEQMSDPPKVLAAQSTPVL